MGKRKQYQGKRNLYYDAANDAKKRSVEKAEVHPAALGDARVVSPFDSSLQHPASVASSSRSGPKRKVAMIVVYNGSRYRGLQINPGQLTVESVLEDAIFRAGGISEENHGDLPKIGWQRAARTDKGVHAGGNVVSFKLICESNEPAAEAAQVARINALLPPDLRVVAFTRVASGFNAKNSCTHRSYEYLLPAIAFRPASSPSSVKETAQASSVDGTISAATDLKCDKEPGADKASLDSASLAQSAAEVITDEDVRAYRLTEQQMADINAVLGQYVGTKNFHNFTTGRSPRDESCKRYIMKCHISGTFESGGCQFVRISMVGASFMLNQIRRMVGMAIQVVRGRLPPTIFDTVFNYERQLVPRAPALGLLLDRPYFTGYDGKVLQTNGGVEPAWEPVSTLSTTASASIAGAASVADAIGAQQNDDAAPKRTLESLFVQHAQHLEQFKKELIYISIFEAELQQRSMLSWLTWADSPQEWSKSDAQDEEGALASDADQ